jgi:predicted thioesterase
MQDAFENRGLDKEGLGHGGIVIAVSRRSAAAQAPHAVAQVGRSARVELTVQPADTAEALGSGDVPVLATPRLVALCEEASCRALEGVLPPEKTSVAGRVQFDHLAPVAVGDVVTAEATLAKVEGRRLVFTVSAHLHAADRAGLVGVGRLTRVVVDRDAFLQKAGERPRT